MKSLPASGVGALLSAYCAPLRQALIDTNTDHVNIIVCEPGDKVLNRSIEPLPADAVTEALSRVTSSLDFVKALAATRVTRLSQTQSSRHYCDATSL
jgi:hypothetical protein